MSRALAIITGYTQKVRQKSMLYSVENYISYCIEVDYSIRYQNEIWTLLKDNISEDAVYTVKGMKFLQGRKGVAFDISDKFN